MPVYEYKGLNSQGKKVQGVKEAESPKSVKTLLRKEGIFPTEIFEEKSGKSDKKKLGGGKKEGGFLDKEVDLGKYFQRVSLDEIAMFTRQLSTLNKASIPLVESLTALVDQTENEKFKRIISQIKDRVNEGSSFADALKDHPSIFSDLFINMVRAGESSGALDVVLARLADFTESQLNLRRKIMGALTYPAVMVVVAIGIIIILMTFVIPKISQLFEGINKTLPFNTRLLIGTSNFLANWWFIIFPCMAGLIIWFSRYLKTEKGRARYDRFVLKVPIFGKLNRMIATTRFASTLATLLSSGVQVLNALDIVKSVVGNTLLAEVIEEAKESVREGESLAAPLKRSGQFAPIVGHMIAIGEQSGQLEEMLEHVARSYESQVEARVNQMTALLEPIILVGMGGVAGFIVISILMPILQLNSSIH